jgi:hypothetical protein
MTGNKKPGSKHEYHIAGNAAIFSGEFKESPVTANIDTQGTDPLERLSEVLTRIIQSLAENSSPNVPPAVREEASRAATALKCDLPNLRKTEPRTRTTLRKRVKALIGLLAPVAEIIAGAAALDGILHQL